MANVGPATQRCSASPRRNSAVTLTIGFSLAHFPDPCSYQGGPLQMLRVGRAASPTHAGTWLCPCPALLSAAELCIVCCSCLPAGVHSFPARQPVPPGVAGAPLVHLPLRPHNRKRCLLGRVGVSRWVFTGWSLPWSPDIARGRSGTAGSSAGSSTGGGHGESERWRETLGCDAWALG